MKDLIFDIGMHHGLDAEFYLRKGFKVVAVEANPTLVEKVTAELSSYIDNESLIIINRAISDSTGTIDFYVNLDVDDWSSTERDAAVRDGCNVEKITVPCMSFEDLIEQHGIPYFLKIDIEGADSGILKCLDQIETKPKYVSFEISLTSLADGLKDLTCLWDIGYRHFKIMNQGLNRHLKCPNPPREGVYIKKKFNGHTSGLFGEETPGKWKTLDTTVKDYIKIVNEQSKHGMHGSLFNTRYSRVYRKFKKKIRQTVGWYDIHAKLG